VSHQHYKKYLIWWVQNCHKNQGACSGLEMSPLLHGLMLSRDQTMQGDLGEDGGAKHVVERLSRDFQLLGQKNLGYKIFLTRTVM